MQGCRLPSAWSSGLPKRPLSWWAPHKQKCLEIEWISKQGCSQSCRQSGCRGDRDAGHVVSGSLEEHQVTNGPGTIAEVEEFEFPT